MTAQTTPHTAETRQLMATVGDEIQRILAKTMSQQSHIEYGESAIMEGVLFGFCAMAFEIRPAGTTGQEVAQLIAAQAARYIASFEAEAEIGPAQGTA